MTKATCRPLLSSGVRISLSTIVPPSPRLPRLIASQAYSTLTSRVSVQTMSESTPRMCASVGTVSATTTVRV